MIGEALPPAPLEPMWDASRRLSSVDRLADAREVRAALNGHVLATGNLVGLFGR